MGEEALVWLQRVKRETGLFTATEVATPEHVDACLRHGIDMLWIGARTTPNPFSVQAIADALRGVDIPVMVKNPINPDLQLGGGALERLHRVGMRKLAAVHRGFSWSGFTPYRNSPMWEFPIRLAAAYPELPLLCDPSHIAGKPEKLHEVAQKALDLNFSGYVEGFDLFDDAVDVVVADGFVGNIVLKTAESLGYAMKDILKRALTANPLRYLGAILASGGLKALKRRMDPEVYGGAVLLGLNGIVVKTHGSAQARAVMNAIRVATAEIRHDLNQVILREIVQANEKLAAAATPAPISP